MKQIIFSDIDGTFQELAPESIPKINIEAVKALQCQGDHFVFISGRNYDQIKVILTDTGLECDMIFSNGAGYCLKNEEPQYTHILSADELKSIIEILEEHNSFYHIHTNDKIIMKPMHFYQEHIKALREKFSILGERGKEVMDFKENYFSNECHHVDDVLSYFHEHPEVKPLKVELMDGNDEYMAQLQKILKDAGFFVYSSFMAALEIINPASSKGAAIKRYLNLFDKTKSYGIGDAENDLSMFDAVDVSIAVGNASDNIKSYCDIVVDDCLNGGVGKFIFDNMIQNK